MKAFEETPECDKCGKTLVKMFWKDSGFILCICQTCLYRWRMHCKDHVETDSNEWVEANNQEQLDNTGAMR